MINGCSGYIIKCCIEAQLNTSHQPSPAELPVRPGHPSFDSSPPIDVETQSVSGYAGVMCLLTRCGLVLFGLAISLHAVYLPNCRTTFTLEPVCHATPWPVAPD
ncbi:MAG: hypothetical protein ACKVH8_17180 [Pirellulales bacterium]